MLVTEQFAFAASPTHKVIASGLVNAQHGNFGTGDRVFKALVYNEGDNDCTITLDGASIDAGYAQNYTTHASQLVKARSKAILTGAVRGSEIAWRLAVITAGGNTNGRVELFDKSDNFKR